MAFCAQNVDSIETCAHFVEIDDINLQTSLEMRS